MTYFDQSEVAICLVILGLEKRFIETLYSRVLNFLWILTEWWLISMTHFDDSFWWLISMTHCDSFWSWQIWSNRFQPRFNFGSEFFHQIIYDLIYFHFKLYRATPIRAHFIENIPDINMVCLNSKCSIAPKRHLAVEMFRFNQFISVATYQNDFSLLAKRIHAMWFCFPTNSNHLTLVTHTHDSWAMSHHDFLNVKIFSILIFWTITS